MVIVAGEASGDLHGANLVNAMRALNPNVSFVGIGGPKMKSQGVETLVGASEIAVVGLSEVTRKVGSIARGYFGLKRILEKLKPSLVILIDFPEFNLHLASKAKRQGIPVMYYISPQVWAWRPGRVKKISALVDRMVCILPFEKEFYEKRGMRVDYVGHPLCDLDIPEVNPKEVLEELGLSSNYPILGLLPGSRDHEVETLLPEMLGAVNLLRDRYPSLGCILPLAPTIKRDKVENLLRSAPARISVAQSNIYRLLRCCHCAVVASGTATLEAAIMGVPMVVAYKVSPITFFLAKRVVKVRHICLVNLVAGFEVVPELIQGEVTPENIFAHLINMLEDEKIKNKMKKDLEGVKRKLGKGGASQMAARIAMEMMGQKSVAA